VHRASTTIIIPAYNEADRLGAGVARLETAGAEGRIDLATTQVLFVDDGSTDDTATVAQQIADRLPMAAVLRQPSNRGKGAAVRAGVRAARSAKLVFTDADLAIDPRQLPSLLAALDEAPVAVGTRAIGGHIDYGDWLRTRAGRSFNLLVRLLSQISMRDTQCGFKGARTAEAKLLFHYTTIDGFAFDVELLARAVGLGWEVREVPVSWRDVPGSHVDVARHSLTMLADLVRARLRSRSLPRLLGLELEPGALEGVAEACRGGSLEAAPLLVRSDGAGVVLAALHSTAEASPALQHLRTVLGGGVVRAVDSSEVAAASQIRSTLA
jgi:glycosyltransferase involved in cell wall biosynthesis